MEEIKCEFDSRGDLAYLSKFCGLLSLVIELPNEGLGGDFPSHDGLGVAPVINDLGDISSQDFGGPPAIRGLGEFPVESDFWLKKILQGVELRSTELFVSLHTTLSLVSDSTSDPETFNKSLSP